MASEQEIKVKISASDAATGKLKDVSKSLDGLKDGVAEAAKGIAIFASAVTAAAAAVGGFAFASAKQFAELGDSIDEMADRTGFATETISGLRLAADRAGISIQGVEGAVKGMYIRMSEAADTTKGLGKIINDDLGVSLKNFKEMKPEEQFARLGQYISGIKDPAERAQMAITAFGKSGMDLLPMFEKGKFNMDEWIQRAKDLGVSFDESAAKKAAKLQDALQDVGTAFEGIKITIGSLVADQLSGLATKLTEITAFISTNIPNWVNQIKAFWAAIMENQFVKDAIDTIRIAFEQVWQIVSMQLWPAIVELAIALEPYKPLLVLLAKLFGLTLYGGLIVVLEVLTAILKIVTALVNLFTVVMKNAIDIAVVAWERLSNALKIIADNLKAVYEWGQKAAQFIGGGVGKIADSAFSTASNVANTLGIKPVGARAGGGSVTGGLPYMVGERGVEMFVPGTSGNIVPNSRLGGMTIVVNNPMFLDESAADKFANLVMDRLKMSVRVS